MSHFLEYFWWLLTVYFSLHDNCLHQIKEGLFINDAHIYTTMVLEKKFFNETRILMSLSLIQGNPNTALLLAGPYKFISSNSLPSPSELSYPKNFIDENQPMQKIQYI